MSKFIKLLTILLLILLVEVIFIYKGYINNKNKNLPSTNEISPYNYTVFISNNISIQRR
jgi:hypothetical protein